MPGFGCISMLQARLSSHVAIVKGALQKDWLHCQQIWIHIHPPACWMHMHRCTDVGQGSQSTDSQHVITLKIKRPEIQGKLSNGSETVSKQCVPPTYMKVCSNSLHGFEQEPG